MIIYQKTGSTLTRLVFFALILSTITFDKKSATDNVAGLCITEGASKVVFNNNIEDQPQTFHFHILKNAFLVGILKT